MSNWTMIERPEGGLDQRGVHVPTGIGLLAARIVFGQPVADGAQRPFVGTHRHQRGKPVAAMHIHIQRHRPQTMRRVQIPVGGLQVSPTPDGAVARADQPVGRAVQIAGFAVRHFAEHALTDHVQNQHLDLAVAAVLQHDAVLPGPFGRIDQVPALIERNRCGHLDSRVMSGIHRRHGHRHMPLPGCDHVDDIDVVPLTEILEIVFAGGVTSRFGLPFPSHGPGRQRLAGARYRKRPSPPRGRCPADCAAATCRGCPLRSSRCGPCPSAGVPAPARSSAPAGAVVSGRYPCRTDRRQVPLPHRRPSSGSCLRREIPG
jgi:hypothetical protein